MTETVLIERADETVVSDSVDCFVTVDTSDVVIVDVGAQGARGPKGDPGSGGGGGTLYDHSQLTPLSTWVIQHDMGRYCSVTVLDSAGTLVVGDVHYDSVNQVTVTFSSAFAGTAHCI